MFETPGPPLEITIRLTAGEDRKLCGVSWNAIGIVPAPGLARSSGTATVPHFAFPAAPGAHFVNVAVGAAAAVAGSMRAARAARAAVRPSMPASYSSAADD
jgi:hypothetical protein